MPVPYNAGGPAASVVLVDPTTLQPYTASGGGTSPAQGSATAGQTGGLVQGATTTNAPTYTTGTTNPLSLDPQGGLRLSYPALPASTDRSGTATTTSGGLSVAANANRKSLTGQNVSGVVIGFNEQGGVAAIGTAGTYTVAAGASFSISTNKLINFIAASGTAAVTMTET
jgi:hypothetical protein